MCGLDLRIRILASKTHAEIRPQRQLPHIWEAVAGLFYYILAEIMIFERQSELLSLVNERIFSLGYECIEVEWLPVGRILRLYIDHLEDDQLETGVSLQDCLIVNDSLKDWDTLDEMIKGAFNLEISSPGIERPLRLLRHFSKHIGEKVNVKLTQEVNGHKNGEGKLIRVTDEGIVSVEISTGLWSFSLESLKKAHLVHNWD